MEEMRKRLLAGQKSPETEDVPQPVVRNLPIPPTSSSTSTRLELDSLKVASRNFQLIKRISANSPQLPVEIRNSEQKGIPLVIEGWHERPTWSKDIFSVDFLLDKFKDSRESKFDDQGSYLTIFALAITVRDVENRVDVQMPFDTFISQSRSPQPDEGMYKLDVVSTFPSIL